MSLLGRLFGERNPHTGDPIPMIRERIQKNEAILLDVRSSAEKERCSVRGSIFIDFAHFENGQISEHEIEKLEKDKTIYCH